MLERRKIGECEPKNFHWSLSKVTMDMKNSWKEELSKKSFDVC